MKVLLTGHACSPARGSELAVTWNWAWHLAREHHVWVLTHPQERAAIEAYLAEHPAEKLQFIWVGLPKWRDPWDPGRGVRWIRLHYLQWQRAVLREAIRLHREISFDVVHHVSWGTVSEPPLVARLPVPFVWGPVGGGQVPPYEFKAYLGPSRKRELVRTIRVRLASYRPALRKAVRRSVPVLATNMETIRILKLAGARETMLFLDSGLSDKFLSKGTAICRPTAELTLFWAGRLEPLKGLPLALDALAQLKELSLRLVVAGRGSMRKPWEEMARRLGIGSRVAFLGQVPHDKMPELYRSAGLFVFTSLRDSFGSQVLEAMGAGLPIVTLDHQGVGAFVPEDAGIKVPVTNPKETVLGLARGIHMLSNSPKLRERMGRAAWEFARTQTWDRRAKRMTEIYESAVRSKGTCAAAGASLSPSPQVERAG